MEEIPVRVLKELFGIPIYIMTSFKDVFSPSKPQSPEERLSSKMKQMIAMINSQQDSLISQAGSIQDQSLRIQALDDLNHQKDKEIRRLAEAIHSLEFELQATNFHPKHWR
ncbi:MAG: hypothetical protein ABSE06_21435 [Anaerolineaceae bacterium]|jgi:hypothetical protein